MCIRDSIICESEDENGIYGLVSEGFGIALVADIINPDNFKVKQIDVYKRQTIDGLFINALPIDVLCCCPPESSLGR